MIDRRIAPYAALVLRLALAFLFFAHLYRKYGVTGYDNWFSGWGTAARAGVRGAWHVGAAEVTA